MVSCPHCGQAIEGDPQLAGRVVACPSCQGQFTMPAASSPLPAPPVVLPPAPQRGAPRRQPPPDYTPRIVAWGITLAIVLVAGVGLIVALALNAASRDAHGPQAAAGKGSAGGSESPSDSGRLPELDQLIGRPFSAKHPDAEARIAEAERRKISVLQSGDQVRIGDVYVSDNPISDYGGFVFGIGQHPDGKVTLTTSGGDEPLRTTNSPASDRRALEQFLQRHHGAANVKIEQLTDEPYYLARLVNLQQKDFRAIEHGRSSQEIQRKLDLTSERSDASPVSIRKLERIGSVVHVVYRLAGTTRSDEEFLVLNGKVVYRFRSGRSAILFED